MDAVIGVIFSKNYSYQDGPGYQPLHCYEHFSYVHGCNQKFHNTHTVMYSTNKRKFMGKVTTKGYSLWLNLL